MNVVSAEIQSFSLDFGGRTSLLFIGGARTIIFTPPPSLITAKSLTSHWVYCTIKDKASSLCC